MAFSIATTVVLAPIPNASDAMATTAEPGLLIKARRP
jgi:hypothetical protein